MPRAALFDMDRTLVRKETGSLYVKYQRDRGEASLMDMARVLRWVAEYTFGVLDIEDVARRVVRTLEGSSEEELAHKCEDWFDRYVARYVAQLGRHAVARHHDRGDIVVIVTGASKYATRPLAKRLAIDHIVTTEFEVDADGRFTGRVLEPLCYGEGKIHKTTALAEKLGFSLDDAIFYSDSFTDLPLLARVGEAVCVNPDPRLRREAKRRGWRVERW
jgi:HAD superfamily hydrolase (TIGR01490 family)